DRRPAVEDATLHLEEALHEKIARAASGKTEVRSLYDWLAAHAQAVIDEGDAALTRLSDRIWILLAEYDSGALTQDELRADLNDLLAARKAPSIAAPST